MPTPLKKRLSFIISELSSLPEMSSVNSLLFCYLSPYYVEFMGELGYQLHVLYRVTCGGWSSSVTAALADL